MLANPLHSHSSNNVFPMGASTTLVRCVCPWGITSRSGQPQYTIIILSRAGVLEAMVIGMLGRCDCLCWVVNNSNSHGTLYIHQPCQARWRGRWCVRGGTDYDCQYEGLGGLRTRCPLTTAMSIPDENEETVTDDAMRHYLWQCRSKNAGYVNYKRCYNSISHQNRGTWAVLAS